MLDIRVRSKKYNCDISIKHKISVFIGDSGVGKSLFVKAVMDKSGAYRVFTSEDVRFILLTQDNWNDTLNANMNTNSSRVFIVDDEDFIYRKEFGELYKLITNSYFVFIVRTTLIKDSSGTWNGVSISPDAIFRFIKNGTKHFTIPAKKYEKGSVPKSSIVDFCLCEDKRSGKQFFETIFKTVLSSESEDNIINYIKQNEKLFIGKTIYLVVDYSAIGFKLDLVLTYLKKLNCVVYFSVRYQSFEYLILRSNFFKLDEEVIYKDLLNYNSLKDRCTVLLEEITKGTNYSYEKSNLNNCFKLDCCCKDRSKFLCDKGIAGDKIYGMLVDTEFSFILYFRQV